MSITPHASFAYYVPDPGTAADWYRDRLGFGIPGDHLDARLHDAVHRVHVARVQLQRGAEDRPIEIEGQQSIRSAGGYLFTSGFRRLGGRPPRTAVAMLRAAIADISDRVRTVALEM